MPSSRAGSYFFLFMDRVFSKEFINAPHFCSKKSKQNPPVPNGTFGRECRR